MYEWHLKNMLYIQMSIHVSIINPAFLAIKDLSKFISINVKPGITVLNLDASPLS